MINTVVKGTKVVLKLGKGSQTISDCSDNATNEQLYALGTAVGELEKETVDAITKVVETTLISE